MAIAISDTHLELATMVRGFLEDQRALQAARAYLDAEADALPKFWPAIVELGWLGLHLPEELGGAGFGIEELVVVLEELGQSVTPGPFLGSVTASGWVPGSDSMTSGSSRWGAWRAAAANLDENSPKLRCWD